MRLFRSFPWYWNWTAGSPVIFFLRRERPEGIPSANFIAIRLSESAQPIGGAVTYAKEFGM